MPFTRHLRTMVRLGMDSGIPADAAVNVWHADEVSAGGMEAWLDALEIFYQSIDSVILSSAIDPTAITATTYDMADPEPRAPIDFRTFGSITTTSAARPPELTMVLSFQGDRVSGQSQARRRGRVYLGPVGNIEATTTSPLIATATVTSVATAAQVLAASSSGATSWTWCVYSPTDNDLVPVTNGWVDNAFDVQRRRGTEPTIRTLFTDT